MAAAKSILYNEKNEVYSTQYATFACVTSFTFKVVMLPSYMASSAYNLAFVALAIMLLVDMLFYGIVYYIISNINLLRINNKWLMTPIMAVIFFLSITKMLVMTSEGISYTATTLFDQGRIIFILIALFIVLVFIVHKGASVMARAAQLVFFIAFFAIGATLLLMRVELDFSALLPLHSGYGGVLEACDLNYFWFGDYIPLLFLSVVPDKRGKSKRYIVPIALACLFVAGVGFYILFTAIYGDAAMFIANAFNKIAVFNKITQLIGPTNFPVIIAWVLMAIVKLSMLFYTAVISLTYFIRKKTIASLTLALACGLIILLAMPNIDKSYQFATSWVRYLAAAGQYGVPIVLLIYVLITKRKNARKSGLIQPSVVNTLNKESAPNE